MLDIHAVVNHFRKVIESEDIKRMYLPFNHFPQGACQDASIMLGAFLSELQFGTFNYILGENKDLKTHSWLENDQYLIDITADQFPGYPKIIISTPAFSKMHIGFNLTHKGTADLKVLQGILFPQAILTYNAIKKYLI